MLVQATCIHNELWSIEEKHCADEPIAIMKKTCNSAIAGIAVVIAPYDDDAKVNKTW